MALIWSYGASWWLDRLLAALCSPCVHSPQKDCLVTTSCPTLWDPIDCSTPAFSVLHCLLEFAQTPLH